MAQTDSWYARMAAKNPPPTYRLYPARYDADGNDWVCEVCGWRGVPGAAGTLAWCPTSRIMCERCGPDVLVSVAT